MARYFLPLSDEDGSNLSLQLQDEEFNPRRPGDWCGHKPPRDGFLPCPEGGLPNPGTNELLGSTNAGVALSIGLQRLLRALGIDKGGVRSFLYRA